MIALAALLFAAAGPQEPAAPRTTSLVLPRGTSAIALRDFDGDGRLDLFAVESTGVKVRFQDDHGAYPTSADGDLEWPANELGWDLVDADGDGASELTLFTSARQEGGTVALVRFAPGGKVARETLLSGTRAFLPAGVRRLRALRDVDGDGRLDAIVPATGRFRIFRSRPRAAAVDEDAAASLSFAATPLEVEFDAQISLSVGDPSRPGSRFAQELRLPWFQVRDVDGDGRTDLLAETVDAVRFYLADPELPERATWSLDLAARRARLEKRDGLDLDDLLANVAPQVAWRAVELDGAAPAELIVQEGAKISLYRSGTRAGADGAPDQLLRASGTILTYFLRDADGDGDLDLQLVRSEALSIARVVRWLVLPGSFDVDLYTYANEAGSFGRKPAKKTTLAVQIPRLLSIEKRIEELGEQVQAREAVPACALDADGDGFADDVADVREGRLLIHRDVLAPGEVVRGLDPARDGFEALLEEYLLADMDGLPDGGRLEFGLEDLGRWRLSAGSLLRERAGDRQPDAALDAVPIAEGLELVPADIDGDGRTELLVIGRDTDGQLVLQIVRP